MRLFIAINIPEEIKEYILTIQKQILDDSPKIKLVNKQQMHLTLKFLGEVAPSKAKETIAELKRKKFKKFSFYLDSVGVFPDENHIRVLWVGFKPEENIISLQKGIDSNLERLFKKEKGFKPHITLCRVKYIEDKDTFLKKIKNIKIENKKIEVKDFRLIKSTLTSDGPIYEDLEIFYE